MVQIVVSGEILDQMRLARGAVELVDPQGNRIRTASQEASPRRKSRRCWSGLAIRTADTPPLKSLPNAAGCGEVSSFVV